MTALATIPLQRAELPDISEVKPLDERDKACFREVREVLSRHGLLERFGLTLLHQHFPLSDDEALLETIDTEKRTLTIKPVPKADLPPSIETQWQLLSGEALLVCHGYCSPGGGHRRWHQQV
jgi:hypothetical protein